MERLQSLPQDQETEDLEISIICPVYRSAATIAELVSKIEKALAHKKFEIILVNDGSPDNSAAIVMELAQKDPRITAVSLRRNFGEYNAVQCGLNFAKGHYAVIIDDDLQNPPEEILRLTEEINQGYDVVYSRYEKKRHSWFRNAGSWFHNLVASYLLDKPKNLYLSSFKAIRRSVYREVIRYRGPFPYIDGLILRTTSNLGVVTVRHETRSSGRSSYTLRKLIRVYLNMFLNFSVMPIRLFTILGIGSFLLSLVLMAISLIEKLFWSGLPAGWSSVFVAVLFFAGLQMLFFGLIGEYLGKQYLDQNGTPQWIVKEVTANQKRYSDD
jgi:polyisoprenyl-phosphate glycosyltransferase